MAEKEINAIVKNVTKTTTEWASATEIPAKGVICVETTTDGDTKIKIGDGTNVFSGLKYLKAGVGIQGTGLNAEIFNDSTTNVASGDYSHAEGKSTQALGYNTHAEGNETTAMGAVTHIEGASATSAVAVGVTQTSSKDEILTLWEQQKFSLVSGTAAHAEGTNCLAISNNAHAEGENTVAYYGNSHSGGQDTRAMGSNSFSHGDHIYANHDAEVAFGTYNQSNTDTLFSIGNGADEDTRSNAFEITKTTGKLFNKEIATINNIGNPNLLINPDFAVNQRGLSEYSGTSIYTVDGWKTYNQTTVEPCNGYLKISSINNTAQHGVLQLIENPEKYAGKRITITASSPVKVNGEAGNGIRAIEVTNGTTNIVKAFGASDEQVTAVYDVPADSTQLYVRFYIRPTESGDQLAFLRWIKAEVGSTPTSFVPPDPATELLKCQRHLCMYKHQNAKSESDKCTIGVGYALTNSIIYAVLPIAAMRHGVSATISYSDLALISGTDTVVDFTNVTALESTDSTIQLAFAVSDQTPGSVYRLRLMNSSAYLAVSKEL